MGTLFVISAVMVVKFPCPKGIPTNNSQIGVAYLAGARFDVAVSELQKGKFFPAYQKGGEEAQAIVHQHDHGEL
jgi:hypothetical protein